MCLVIYTRNVSVVALHEVVGLCRQLEAPPRRQINIVGIAKILQPLQPKENAAIKIIQRGDIVEDSETSTSAEWKEYLESTELGPEQDGAPSWFHNAAIRLWPGIEVTSRNSHVQVAIQDHDPVDVIVPACSVSKPSVKVLTDEGRPVYTVLDVTFDKDDNDTLAGEQYIWFGFRFDTEYGARLRGDGGVALTVDGPLKSFTELEHDLARLDVDKDGDGDLAHPDFYHNYALSLVPHPALELEPVLKTDLDESLRVLNLEPVPVEVECEDECYQFIPPHSRSRAIGLPAEPYYRVNVSYSVSKDAILLPPTARRAFLRWAGGSGAGQLG